VSEHRTTQCSRFGHPELTVVFDPLPIPGIEKMLLGYFEGAVSKGVKFRPGQTLQFGWSTLRFCERADGTLGVEERVVGPQREFTEGVGRALYDMFVQTEIVRSVGLEEQIDFPGQDDLVMFSECAQDAEARILTRLPDEEGQPDDFSGWSLTCAQEHDHGERKVLPLIALKAFAPGLVQLLGLPRDTVVFVQFVAKPDAPAGHKRIEPHVFRDGNELTPKPGSYLAGLQR
jgi:hypothetical protein